jgi:hypothetical protein
VVAHSDQEVDDHLLDLEHAHKDEGHNEMDLQQAEDGLQQKVEEEDVLNSDVDLTKPLP